MNGSWLKTLLLADLKNVPSWPWPLQGLCFGLLIVAETALGWTFWIAPEQRLLEAQKQNETELKVRYQQRADKHNELRELLRQQTQLQAHQTSQLAMLPAAIITSDFVAEVTRLGVTNHLVFTQFEVGEVEALALISALPFSLLLRGRYQDFILFFKALSAMEQVVTLGDFEMQTVAPDLALLELRIDAKALHLSQAGVDVRIDAAL